MLLSSLSIHGVHGASGVQVAGWHGRHQGGELDLGCPVHIASGKLHKAMDNHHISSENHNFYGDKNTF